MTDEELDALVKRLDNLFAMLEEEGYYTKANTAYLARKAITDVQAQMAEVKQLYEICKEQLHYASRRADRAEAERAAQIEVDDLPPFHFDRYINGVLMAEGVTINKEPTIDRAMMAASRIASKGPNGEVPVLVYLTQPHDRTALDRMLAEARAQALREVADFADTSINKGGLAKLWRFPASRGL